MMAWQTRSAFIDIGTPESYAQVERYLQVKNQDWRSRQAAHYRFHASGKRVV